MRRRLAAAALSLAVAGCGATGERDAVPVPADDRPSDFTPVAGDDRDRPGGRFWLARLKRATAMRERPRGSSLARLRARTEFGSPRVLGVVSRRGRWLEVLAAELPNRRTGWIREDDARLAGTNWSVVVDRSRRRLSLRRGDRVVRSFAVAVGRPGNETPLGRFAVTDRLRPERPGSVYGCCAVALSGHQTRLLPGWPGGDRLAIHGTPQEWTVGKAVSLGCMRARRGDMRALMRRVPLGAPVFIRR